MLFKLIKLFKIMAVQNFTKTVVDLEVCQSHIINQNGATSGFKMRFAPNTFGAGSQRPLPKHSSNPDSAIMKFNGPLMYGTAVQAQPELTPGKTYYLHIVLERGAFKFQVCRVLFVNVCLAFFFFFTVCPIVLLSAHRLTVCPIVLERGAFKF